MNVTERTPGDCTRLEQRIRHERNAKQRDRYRAALLAIQGHQTQPIINALARSRGFVQRWVYAYRDGGIEAIAVKPQPGAQSKLSVQQQQRFIARFATGPTDADGVCTLRGTDALRILRDEFGVKYSLPGVYDLLHRLGFSCLQPRPKHRKQDPQVQQQWLHDAPLLSRPSGRPIRAKRSKSGSRTKRDSASKAH